MSCEGFQQPHALYHMWHNPIAFNQGISAPNFRDFWFFRWQTVFSCLSKVCQIHMLLLMDRWETRFMDGTEIGWTDAWGQVYTDGFATHTTKLRNKHTHVNLEIKCNQHLQN